MFPCFLHGNPSHPASSCSITAMHSQKTRALISPCLLGAAPSARKPSKPLQLAPPPPPFIFSVPHNSAKGSGPPYTRNIAPYMSSPTARHWLYLPDSWESPLFSFTLSCLSLLICGCVHVFWFERVWLWWGLSSEKPLTNLLITSNWRQINPCFATLEVVPVHCGQKSSVSIFILLHVSCSPASISSLAPCV